MREGVFFDSRYRSRNDDGGYIGGIVVKGFVGDARNIICFTFEKDAVGYYDIYPAFSFRNFCIDFNRIKFGGVCIGTIMFQMEMETIGKSFVNIVIRMETSRRNQR